MNAILQTALLNYNKFHDDIDFFSSSNNIGTIVHIHRLYSKFSFTFVKL